MARSRDFSVFLLKEGFDGSNALKLEHRLNDTEGTQSLPPGSTMFVLDNPPHPPWWREYFGIKKKMLQESKGAIVFLPSGGRVFALCFGHVSHNLTEDCYEYDFGLRSTLNCVDPRKLKNTDVVEPGAARRRRTQLSMDSDLTYFDFDRDSTVLRSITGKVKDEYADIIKQATGASSLRIGSTVIVSKLAELCAKLLDIYNSDEYKTTFAEIQNIVPVRDPVIIEQLSAQLRDAVQTKAPNVYLTVPEILDYQRNFSVTFAGQGAGLLYGDVSMGLYYEYLTKNGYSLATIDIADLKRHDLVLTNEEGEKRRSFSIYRSLIFDTTLSNEGGATYHLSEGHWYQVDQDYLHRLNEFLDARWVELDLPECVHHLESEYNRKIAESGSGRVCLDMTNITPTGQTQIEPCDVFETADGRARLIHIKISTDAPALSHLFNQGANSMELLKSEPESVQKLIKLVRDRSDAADAGRRIAPIEAGNFEVAYAIITKKDGRLKSANLPLFSRVSLRRSLRALDLMNIPAAFGFVHDEYDRTTGRAKKRKPRKPKARDSANRE